MPRRINRARVERAVLEGELAQPGSRRGRIFARLGALMRARSRSPAFHPNSGQTILTHDARVFAVLRTPARGNGVLCLHNVTTEQARFEWPGFGSGDWKDLLNGERPALRNSMLELEPYAVRWLALETV
jgi:sucrose phosphorylase